MYLVISVCVLNAVVDVHLIHIVGSGLDSVNRVPIGIAVNVDPSVLIFNPHLFDIISQIGHSPPNGIRYVLPVFLNRPHLKTCSGIPMFSE